MNGGDDRSGAERLHEQFNAVWGNPRGWRALTIVNHGAVGLRFMLTGLGFFLVGGVLAMLVRVQLAMPGSTVLTPEAYAQIFTMHGTVMMFLFAVPMMEGLAVYLLPKMLGARDLVFPRLSAFGYWCYLLGGLILVSSLFLGLAPDAGWFMYVPLSGAVYSPGPNADFWLLGLTFVEISGLAAGVELAVSTLRARAPGMSLGRMPLYAWYMLVTALMIVVAFPPLVLASILLELERAAGMPFFDVARGGDPLLWQHLFWLFGHPEVYIIFLPAAGIVSMLLPVFAQRPPVGYAWVVGAAIATGVISFVLWVHHMFAVGIPHMAKVFFSAASMLVALPAGIQVFSWLATLWLGRPVFHVPMLWLTGFLVIFVAGGLTGVMLALVPFDWQVHDTHFVVAHLHYVLVGGMFFPLVAAVYYWLPHFSGRMPSPRLGRTGFWLVFVGFNLSFLVMHWTGLLGMPRRVHTYEAGLGWDLPNLLSSVGSFVMAAGIAAVLCDIVIHFRFGARAGCNPWRADTLEWATTTPPAPYNFASLPVVTSRHPLWDRPALGDELARGEGGLALIDHGRRETWGSAPVSGAAREIIHLPANSWLPFGAALLLAGVCVALLLQAYPAAAFFTIGAAAVLLRWSWENGAQALAAHPLHRAAGDPPLHSHTADGPGLWGMRLSLVADGAFYLALLFGWFTLAMAGADRATAPVGGEGGPLLFAAVAMTVAAGWVEVLVVRLRRGKAGGLGFGLAAVAAVGVLQCVLILAAMPALAPEPTARAHDAVSAALLGYSLVHGALATVLAALQALRVRRGYVGVSAPYEPRVMSLLWRYSAAVLWCTWLALILFAPT